MNNEPIDLLKIKIEKAKRELSEDTLSAINAVDWRLVILGMRQSKGYSFEQLGDLETETELLLCGLVSPDEYPKELEKRMNLPRPQVNDLVKEMNQLVFSKIREQFIKITEQKKPAERSIETPSLPVKVAEKTVETPRMTAPITQIHKDEEAILNKAGIKINNLDAAEKSPVPVPANKLAGDFQIPSAKTEHTIPGLSKSAEENKQQPPVINPGPETFRQSVAPVAPKVMADIKPAPSAPTKSSQVGYKKDPYRLSPNE